MCALYVAQIGNYTFNQFGALVDSLAAEDRLSAYQHYVLDISYSGKYSMLFIYCLILCGFYIYNLKAGAYYKLLNMYIVSLAVVIIFPFDYVSRITDYFMVVGFMLSYILLDSIKDITIRNLAFSLIAVGNFSFVVRILYQQLM